MHTEVVCNIYGNEFMNGLNDLKLYDYYIIMFNKLYAWKNKIKQYVDPIIRVARTLV